MRKESQRSAGGSDQKDHGEIPLHMSLASRQQELTGSQASTVDVCSSAQVSIARMGQV